jgi:hypothetical protein
MNEGRRFSVLLFNTALTYRDDIYGAVSLRSGFSKISSYVDSSTLCETIHVTKLDLPFI